MLFNSFEFGLFLPSAIALYYLLKHRYRWIALLGLSCVFYMAFVPKYILILFLIILIDYSAAIGIERARLPAMRKALLGLSLTGNLGILALFKYYNWFLDNSAGLVRVAGYSLELSHLSWILPIGLSFHTFQSISYTIEVYRGRFKAERHLGVYANYVLFFPQLVAGPIERPYNLIPQLKEEHRFSYARAVAGLRLMLVGFLMKCVVADNLAATVAIAFQNPAEATPVGLVIGTIFFTFQIYCDFAGYSLIAIGSARILGIDLMNNFASPYLAQSIQEFWRRWHISLSTWFRDYLYIPMGGSRSRGITPYVTVLVVFIVSGLWHGANWTFVAWGALHGFYLICGRLLPIGSRWRLRSAFLAWAWTLTLVSFAWIFFRAATLGSAVFIVGRIFAVHQWHLVDVIAQLSRPEVDFGFLLIVALMVYERWRDRLAEPFVRYPSLRWATYYGAVVAIAILGKFEGRQFIYFQF